MKSQDQRHPYKFLDSYTLEDRDLFFGRDIEIAQLYKVFYTQRLTIVYGESGSGKTSLIQCGLQTEILKEDALFIPVRIAEIGAEKSLRQGLLKQLEDKPENNELNCLLEELWYQESCTLVLVLDQFEEFFLFQTKNKRDQFTQKLAYWLKNRSYIRIIISIREDYYAYLTEMEKILPEIFDNRYRVLPMSRKQAYDVIIKPCEYFNIKIEHQLVDKLLTDLLSKNKKIDLPILQVALDRLYKLSIKNNSDKLRIKDYSFLGEINKILTDFIASTLDKYKDKEMARQILKTLVTEQGMRKVRKLKQLKSDILSQAVIVDESIIKAILQQLSIDRLIKDSTYEDIYELRHDSLAKAFLAWNIEAKLENSLSENKEKNRYQNLLSRNLYTEKFVRVSLSILEADLREMALLCLQECLILDINSPNLFYFIRKLQRPKWGIWDGLIVAINKERLERLKIGDKKTIKKIEESSLSDLLCYLHRPINVKKNKFWLEVLYGNRNQKVPRKLTMKDLLTFPIFIRNKIIHNAPDDNEFWRNTNNSLNLLVGWLSKNIIINDINKFNHLSPWFIKKDGKDLMYRGMSTLGDTVYYTNRKGVLIKNKHYLPDVLLAFKKIVGKAELQQLDYKKLMSELSPDEHKGILIEDYLIGRDINNGAHGVIHKGRQLSTGKKVAIKFLKDDANDEIALRFKQEAELLARLDHTVIVNIISYIENQPWSIPKKYSLDNELWYQNFKKGNKLKTFIVMEWVKGTTLDEYYLEKKNIPIDFKKITKWFIDIATAFEYIHQADIIHCDIKPNNLIITEQGDIKLIDFGISHDERRYDLKPTMNLDTCLGDTRLGSPAYMSPELIFKSGSTKVTAATDIYSLTAVFYELYTQTRLFNHDKEDIESIMMKKKYEHLLLPAYKINKIIPWELSVILEGGLEKEVKDRYRNMENIKQDLVHYINDEPIGYIKPSLYRKLQLGYQRNKKLANITSLLLAALAVITIFYLHSFNVEQRQKNTLIQYLNSNLKNKLEKIGEKDMVKELEREIDKSSRK